MTKKLERIYSTVFAEHISKHRQMVFVPGPRQVGKTTTCREIADVYLDWDNEDHREIILQGPGAIFNYAELSMLSRQPRVLVFDELHKYSRWKQLLKGFYDTYPDVARIIVTGSSRLDVYRRGGDSLMGRYFLYHMHPLSVGELVKNPLSIDLLHEPKETDERNWGSLWTFGGFPEPFINHDEQFSRRWNELRRKQLFREDVRDLTRIQELGQLETLGRVLGERSGGQIVYANLSRMIRVSENTVRNWIETLCSLHYGFLVRPWYRNIDKALRKEPKWFLRDWSGIHDPGSKGETYIACHLLKAVEGWTDLGFGTFELRYVRDKQKREVDFLIIRDDEPWILIEVKQAETKLSPLLGYFQRQCKCAHALQVVIDLPFVKKSCFEKQGPQVVPARTLLSQLM